MNVTECLINYGKAWFEPDDERRIEVLRTCCTEDVIFVDSNGRADGLEAVSKWIGGYINGMGGDAERTGESESRERGRTGDGVSVDVVTPIDELDGFFRYSFVWTLPDGSKSGGTDFCQLAEDGRMKVITVWPANDAFPLPDVAR